MAQRIHRFILMFALLGLLIAPMAGVGGSTTATAQSVSIEVEPQLLNQLAADETSGYLIYFDAKPDLSRAATMSWEDRGQYVYDQLSSAAAASQAKVKDYLEKQGAKYEAFWVDNIIVVENSNRNTFNGLLNFSEIQSLRVQREVFLIEPDQVEPAASSAPTAVEPSLQRVQAPGAWALGFDGEGLVVGSIDTGVRYTHQALTAKYRGNLGGGSFNHNYNWWDPYAQSAAPNDSHDHGSHVTGTMVGDDGSANQIGIAPGAKWIACQGFSPSATNAGLLSCAQFMLAPTDLAGANPNPSLRPHAVNNSWGDCGRSYDGWYQSVINNWHAAGVYPVFSNGNASNCSYSSPPGLNTVGNPARYGNVTGVGSTGNNNGTYANHSNWGPTDNLDTVNANGHANLKPQVVAPGVSIRSSLRGSDSAYGTMSGTSMSSPQVTGLIAVVWQAAPCLIGNYGVTESLLEQSATPLPYASNKGDEGPNNVPNHATGWGEINALKAVQTAQTLCGPQGTLTGLVTNAATNAPLANVPVRVTNGTTVTLSLTSDSQGRYTTDLPVGTYTVSASTYGYQPLSVPNVVISENVTTTQNLQLTPLPSATISGTVTDDSGHGWPLYSRIDIAGSPDSPIFTDPVDGTYSVSLLQSTPYTFTVTALCNGYNPEVRGVTPPAGGATENFGLKINGEACSAPGYGTDYVFFEDFEADNGQFTVSGTTSWAWGTPTSGPGAAFSGTKVWATNLNGSYGINENGYLTSPIIDLSAHATKTPVVQWRQWLNSESGYDMASVEVSKDSGATWTRVYGLTSGDFSGQGWTRQSATLDSSYAVATFQLRFRFTSDNSANRLGWYIDDLGIGTTIYEPGVLVFSESFESATFPPTGWTRFNVDGGGSQWERNTVRASDGTASARHNFSSAANQDGWLVAPAVAVPATGGQLSWDEYTTYPDDYERHTLYVCTGSCDSPPANYTEVREISAPVESWRRQEISLSAYAGQTVRFAWRYQGNNADGWYIDNVTVRGPATGTPYLPCTVRAGGMVLGTVTDANTGAGLVNATVTNMTAGGVAASIATPADPAVGDGFFSMFAPTGNTVLRAAKAGYAQDEQSISIAPNSMNELTFELGAPIMLATPGAITVTLVADTTTTRTLTLQNDGTADGSVLLEEYLGHQLPPSMGGPATTAEPAKVNLDALKQELPADARTLTIRPATAAAPDDAGLSATSWYPLPPLPVGTGRASAQLVDGKIYVFGGQNSSGNAVSVPQVYDTATDSWSATLPAMPTPLTNVCAAAIDDAIYIAGGSTATGVITSVQVFHTDTMTWTIDTANPLPAAQWGSGCAAYNGKIYLFGGTTGANLLNVARVYDPAAASGSRWSTLANVPVASYLGGAAVIGDTIFYAGFRTAANTNPPTVYGYKPSTNTWTTYPSLQQGRAEAAVWALDDTLYVGGGGVGLYHRTLEQYDTTTGISGTWSFGPMLMQGRQAPAWVADQPNRTLYAIGGYNGSIMDTVESFTLPMDVPWLSLERESLTMPEGESESVGLTFDTTGLATGTYKAQILADITNSPYTPQDKVTNLTLVVVAAAYGVEASAADAEKDGSAGTQVTYTINVTNTGNTTDSFSATLSGFNWPTALSAPTVGPLAPNESATLEVTVTIPAGTPSGQSDDGEVTLTSMTSSQVFDTVDLTTSVGAIHGVNVTASTMSHTAAPGTQVTYVVTLTNTGNVTDTFTLALSGHSWTSTLNHASLTLGPGKSGTVTVTVSIPANPADEDDSTTLTATSQGNSAATDTITLTTTAEEQQRKIFLPYLRR